MPTACFNNISASPILHHTMIGVSQYPRTTIHHCHARHNTAHPIITHAPCPAIHHHCQSTTTLRLHASCIMHPRTTHRHAPPLSKPSSLIITRASPCTPCTPCHRRSETELRRQNNSSACFFVRRDVTRAAELCAPLEDAVTDEVFDRALAAGQYELHWGKYGTR